MEKRCSRCGKAIAPKESYPADNALLCETCYMDARLTRPRKTHWQYIRSIKADYLRPPARKA